jgi:hypothetical protein
MSRLEAADHRVEQITLAVGDKPPPPGLRELQVRGEAGLAGHESGDDPPPVGPPLRRLHRPDIALVGTPASAAGGEAGVGLQGDPGRAGAGGDPMLPRRMGVGREDEPRRDHSGDPGVHHPGDRRIGPPHRRA